MDEIKEYTEKLFEDIKHIDENGNEYWLARELMSLLEYSKWERFSNAIDNAKMSCIKSGYSVDDHFPDVGKMVQIGSKTNRKLKDYKLSRYACYLIAQNGDSRKKTIALALKKEHIGQIQVYMNYIDSNLRKINQDKTIGIIICKKDNKYVIEYCSDDRIISREYVLV